MSNTQLSPKDKKRLAQCLAIYKKKNGKNQKQIYACLASILKDKNKKIDAGKIREDILKITRDMQVAAIQSTIHYTYWYSNNLENFYMDTTSSPGLSTGADIVKRTSGTLFSTATKSAGKSAFKSIGVTLAKSALSKAATIAIAEKTAEKIFKTFAHVALAWVGGIALDVVLVYIHDSFTPNETDLAILRNNDKIKAFCQTLRDKINAQINTKIEEVKREFNQIDATIRKINDVNMLLAIKKQVEQEHLKIKKGLKTSLQKSKSKALYAELLSNWVKENAGDDSDDPAKDGSNEAQWNKAVKILQGLDKNQDTTDDKFDLADKTHYQFLHGTVHELTGQADTCMHQLIRKLDKMGLNKKQKNVQKLLASLGKLNFNADHLKSKPTALQKLKVAIENAKKKVENTIFYLNYNDIKDAPRLGAYLQNSIAGNDVPMIVHYLNNHKTYQQHPTKGIKAFDLQIQLTINISEGNLMVLKYKYSLKIEAKSKFLDSNLSTYKWEENSDNGLKK